MKFNVSRPAYVNAFLICNISGVFGKMTLDVSVMLSTENINRCFIE